MENLDISAIIGFTGFIIKNINFNKNIGKVNSGLILHPDNEHLIYPLGSTIVVRHIISRTQTFLRGHDKPIT